nr:RNA-directed DNA polymerase, eukaryota, nucleotide-binding alpha-beta plait domain protein [Tanacetum cinerariifolium]
MENSKKSFVSVLKRGSQSHVTPKITKPALVLDETCIKEFDFGMSLMGRAKDVSAIPNLHCIISKEGFYNVKLSYLGGMWVLFEFDYLASKEKFLNHSGIGSWFTELIQAIRSFENDERIVWIFIEGLPIKAWTPNTFRKIASLWGEQKVIIQGKVYWIRVKELDAWFSNFQEDDKDDLSSDGESQEGDVANKSDNNESDVDRVSESSFMHENDTAHKDEKLLQHEQWAYLSTNPSKRLTSFCYDDDDDDDEDYTSSITPNEPVLSTEEPDNSLSMGDEHLDTIPAKESNEFIKSGVETLILIPSESEGIPEHMCDVPSHDNSPPLDVSNDQFEDLSESNEEFSSTDDDSFSFDKIDYVEASPADSELVSSEVMEIVIQEVGRIKASNDNPIPFYDPIISGTPPTLTPSGESDFFLEVDAFLAVEDEPTSSQFPKSDDQSCSDEDVLEKIISKPLFEEEIIPLKSSRTHDSFLPISSKIDSLLDEFAGEPTLLKSIPPGIDETDCDFEEDIRLIEKLLYDNSSPRPPKEFVSANSDAKIKSFSPSPILDKDSDSLMEEIDLFCTPDYPMPPGIEDKDYDSKRDILIRKDLPRNNTLSFAEKESFNFDIPLFSRPPAKPPYGDT